MQNRRLGDMPMSPRFEQREQASPARMQASPGRMQTSPARIFGSSAVRFVSADGAAYEPPITFVPSDPPILLQQRTSPAREHSPWLRGSGSQGAPSTSPGGLVKRHRSPMLQRDSLKQRYSPGRPGSRRHQRFQNDQALREDLTDQDLRDLYSMDWRSALSELFEDSSKMQAWQDFCSSTEEEQRAMLVLVKRSGVCKKRAVQPLERFKRIDRRVKALVKRGVGRGFLAMFEHRLCQLVYGAVRDEEMLGACGSSGEQGVDDVRLERTRGGAVVVLNDAMHRLLAHAVCLYHSIQSFTRDYDSEGDSAISTSSHTSPHTPSAATSSIGSPAKLLIMLWPHTNSQTHTPTLAGDPTDVHALPAGTNAFALEQPSLSLHQFLMEGD